MRNDTRVAYNRLTQRIAQLSGCLLYTSDAADE